MSAIESRSDKTTLGQYAYGMSLTLTDRNLLSPFRAVRKGYIVPSAMVNQELDLSDFNIRSAVELIDENITPEFNFLGLLGISMASSRVGRKVMAILGQEESEIERKVEWHRKYKEVNRQKRRKPQEYTVYKRKPTFFVPKIKTGDLLR